MAVPVVAMLLLLNLPSIMSSVPCNGQKATMFAAPVGTRSEVRKFCQDQGGDLVSLHSRDEAQEAARLCDPKWTCHIGLQVHSSGSGWEWVDGSPVDYTAWATGEPVAGGKIGFVIGRGGRVGKFKTPNECKKDCYRKGICKKSAVEPRVAAGGASCLLSAQPDSAKRSLRLFFAGANGAAGDDMGIEVASVIERGAGVKSLKYSEEHCFRQLFRVTTARSLRKHAHSI